MLIKKKNTRHSSE